MPGISTELDRVSAAVVQVNELPPGDPTACAWVETAIWLSDVLERLRRMIAYCRVVNYSPENQERIRGLKRIQNLANARQLDTDAVAREVVALAAATLRP